MIKKKEKTKWELKRERLRVYDQNDPDGFNAVMGEFNAEVYA